jgi:hypothetical protein
MAVEPPPGGASDGLMFDIKEYRAVTTKEATRYVVLLS